MRENAGHAGSVAVIRLLSILKAVALSSVAVALAASSAPAFTQDVIVRTFEFVPRDIAIAAGDSVRWIWEEGTHSVTEGSDCIADNPLFDEDLYPSNPVFIYRFDEAGFYEYFCRLHCVFSDMRGSVTVTSSGVIGTTAPAGKLSAGPNPTLGGAVLRFSASGTGRVRFEIFDAAGRSVRSMSAETRRGSLASLEWDGNDALGRPVGPGLYFVRAGEAGLWRTVTLVVVR